MPRHEFDPPSDAPELVEKEGRFLIDECLGAEAARVISRLGWNAIRQQARWGSKRQFCCHCTALTRRRARPGAAERHLADAWRAAPVDSRWALRPADLLHRCCTSKVAGGGLSGDTERSGALSVPPFPSRAPNSRERCPRAPGNRGGPPCSAGRGHESCRFARRTPGS